MGASVLEKKMHYPVMTERQLAARWKISLKTLRRWRSDNEGPTWHKLFQYVRYHEADPMRDNRIRPAIPSTLNEDFQAPSCPRKSSVCGWRTHLE